MSKTKINLNHFRENKFQYAGLRPCPCYGEDGVFLKIFEEIGVSSNPECVEFGELRSLGTTTRAFRITQKARALYFSGTMDLKSIYLNILDILKISWTHKSLKFLKFLFSMPFKDFAYPETIGAKIKNFATNPNELDLVVVDIDSFDFEIVSGIFDHKVKPRVMVVEYNPSLPPETALYWPYDLVHYDGINPRLYGASYKTWEHFMTSEGYSLVHISGFCNLIYIRGDIQHPFSSPSIKAEITDTKEKVEAFCKNYCLPGFTPSWNNSKKLNKSDLKILKKLF
jgi:hypothetical protein